jgi:hypothetical protein
VWFVGEKFKQREPARILYADWIILLKEQFSCLPLEAFPDHGATP